MTEPHIVVVLLRSSVMMQDITVMQFQRTERQLMRAEKHLCAI